MLAILLALQLTASPSVTRAKGALAPDSILRLHVDSATRAFQFAWQAAWQDTQNARPSHLTGDSPYDKDERNLALHCHSADAPPRIRRYMIKGMARAQASCPIWYARDGVPIDDERRGIDGGLARDQRGAIRVLRARLRALLDSASRQLPDDLRITTLRVRFALDAKAFADAWEIASACTVDAVRCGLLRGLVHYRSGHVFQADSSFLVAAAFMPDAERCAWNNIAVLLDADTRRGYETLPCADRAELERKVWWLADPLYLEPGNERRAEHFARLTSISVLSTIDVDERQHWRPDKGGEAVAETLVRYGWPSQMFWGGVINDRNHDEWLRARGIDTAGPYMARQYSRDRLRTLPVARAIVSPFDARVDDWQLDVPSKRDDEEWPIEHFARDASPLVQLPVGQSVIWLRQHAPRFVWAADLDARALARARGDTVTAVVFESRAVSDITTVGAFAASLQKPILVDAALPAGNALLSIEIGGDSTHAAARTRFGLAIPEPLKSGAARSLSQPVLLAPSYDANVQLDAEAASQHMLGTTALSKPRRIGIYWEAYGFAAADTVDLEVHISREDRPGIFSRVVGAFRLGEDRDTRVGMRWREAPGSSRAIQRTEGTVPVQLRSVLLDIAGLARGSYRLQITMTSGRSTPISNDRAFSIR